MGDADTTPEEHRLEAHALRAWLMQAESEPQESRRREDVLRGELGLCGSLFDAAADGMGVLDKDGYFLACSKGLADLYGCVEAEILGKLFTDFMTVPSIAVCMEKFSELRELKPMEGEVQIIRKDGSVADIWHKVVPLSDSSGGLANMVVFDRDITDRKRADEQLQENRRFLQKVIDGVPDPLMVIDSEYRLLLVNRAAQEQTGAAEPLSHSLRCHQVSHRIDTPCGGADHVCPLSEVRRTKRPLRAEHRHPGPDGTVVVFDIAAAPIFDENGEVAQIIELMRDITDRKRTEEALRKERDFSASLLQASPTFFVGISAEGRTLMMNEVMLTALGYTEEEVLGTNYLDTFVPEPDRELLAGIFNRLVHSREATLNENRVLTKDGRELLVEWHGRPLFKDNGQFDFFFGVGIDITERRKQEEEKARVEAELRHAHKMQAVGQLAAGVAHDFNSVLTVILSNAERLLSKMRQEQPDSADAVALGQIVESVERGAALVERLLTFGRARGGKPQVLDLNRIVADMERMLRPIIGDQIEFKMTSASEIRPIYADVRQIEEAVMNLILNARDAMPDGGRLTVETANVTFDSAYTGSHTEAKPGSHVMLCVSDTGVGMNGDTMQRLFEPFFTTKPTGKGTGLGLSIVHGIVKQAGGHIEVTSQPGKGAAFKLYFPAAE
jgi:two-component system cell cycle sensor histidine kinase/response regulator CckA